MTILSREEVDRLTVAPQIDLIENLKDTARAYHDLRDAVLRLADDIDNSGDNGGRWIREAVARVDGSGNGAGAVADGAP